MYNRKHFGHMPQTFGGILESVLENGMPRFKGEYWTSNVPVNIQETDAAYELQMVAPGLKKEEFRINLDQNILTISYEHKEQKEETTENSDKKEPKVLRSEYQFRSFKRSFTLNEKIDAAGISAKYNDGVLHVTMPKKQAEEKTAQTINVA